MSFFKSLFNGRGKSPKELGYVFAKDLNEKTKRDVAADQDVFLKKVEPAAPVLKYEHAKGFSYLPSRIVDNAGIEWFSKYKYDSVEVDRSKSSFDEIFDGDKVDIKCDNIDNNVIVSLLFNEEYVGFISDQRISEMIYDFLNRGEPVKAMVKISYDKKLSAKIYFYKKVSDYLPGIAPFIVKLTRSGSEEIQENIFNSHVGESVTIELEDDKYWVWGTNYELGCIPNSKLEYIEDLEMQGYLLEGKIHKIEPGSNGKDCVWVEVAPR